MQSGQTGDDARNTKPPLPPIRYPTVSARSQRHLSNHAFRMLIFPLPPVGGVEESRLASGAAPAENAQRLAPKLAPFEQIDEQVTRVRRHTDLSHQTAYHPVPIVGRPIRVRAQRRVHVVGQETGHLARRKREVHTVDQSDRKGASDQEQRDAEQ